MKSFSGRRIYFNSITYFARNQIFSDIHATDSNTIICDRNEQ